MNNLQEVTRYVRSAIDQHCVFVHMTAPQIETLLAGLEELQSEVDRLNESKAKWAEVAIKQHAATVQAVTLRDEHAAMKERCVKVGIFRALRHFQQQGLCDGYEYEEIEEFINHFY